MLGQMHGSDAGSDAGPDAGSDAGPDMLGQMLDQMDVPAETFCKCFDFYCTNTKNVKVIKLTSNPDKILTFFFAQKFHKISTKN